MSPCFVATKKAQTIIGSIANFFLAIGLFMLMIQSANAQTSCDTYASNSTPPQGFGTPWNVLSTTKELLLKSECNQSSVKLTAGSGGNNQFIYKTGYYYKDGWQPFTFQGTPANGTNEWLVNAANYMVQGNIPTGTLNWIAYVCQRDSAAEKWKCGCRDAVCAKSFWQLQAAKQKGDMIPPSQTKCPGPKATLNQCPKGCIYYGVPLGCITQEHYDCIHRGECPAAICLAHGTKIGTPRGDMAVESITPGMLVWTVDAHGERVSAPVIRVSKTPVSSSHHVVHMTLADGRSLFVSPGHPTGEGRTIGELKKGHTLDGVVVQETVLVSYTSRYTYDILPDGATGEYFANGILIGSTLK